MRKLYSISKKILYRDSPVISDHSSIEDEVEVQPELARKTVYEDHRRGRNDNVRASLTFRLRASLRSSVAVTVVVVVAIVAAAASASTASPAVVVMVVVVCVVVVVVAFCSPSGKKKGGEEEKDGERPM